MPVSLALLNHQRMTISELIITAPITAVRQKGREARRMCFISFREIFLEK